MFRFIRQSASTLALVAATSSLAQAQVPPAEPPPGGAAATPAEAPKPITTAYPAAAPLKVEASNGASIKLGILLQPQFQAANDPALSGWSKNLFIRRTRILVGGSILGGLVDYFIDTDYANMFLPVAATMPTTTVMNDMVQTVPTYNKQTPGMNIQDAFVTLKPVGDMAKIDVGYMLPPLTHNALQGAGTLYSWDYFSNSFPHSNVFGTSSNPVGRDLGVQVRGLVQGGLIEYRAGLFQGLRQPPTATEVGARNFFRATARVQVNVFDAEPGFFYGGTYFGSKRILSFGLSGDIQGDYKYVGVDGFTDLPLGPGVVTGQVNIAHWNGNGGYVPLAKQTAVMLEGGYHFTEFFHLNPMARFELRSGSGAVADENRFSLGGAWWPYGHNMNVKVFYTHVTASPMGAADRKNSQINVQLQVYYF